MATAQKASRPPSEGEDEAANPIRVLVVDDESSVRESIQHCLEPLGHDVTPTSGSDHARVAIERRHFNLALLDLRLGSTSGLDLIPELLDADPSLAVVVMTGFGTIETAVEAMRRGAFDYITKPLSPVELQMMARRVAERSALQSRLQVLEENVESASPPPVLESAHPAMARAIETARSVATTDATALITGESGTGKGVLARAMHEWSGRSGRPLATVNCPSLSSELLRSELFGHVKGSFTGATDTKVGKIEFADGGTLFLDEVGEITKDIQPRLLRFLQDKEYERVGDPEPRYADVRLIAATNRELEAAVKAGEFRSDLYYRLNVIEIELLPLRTRPDDIPALADSFLRFFSARYQKRIDEFTDKAVEAMKSYRWPGNIRELKNVVERAVILSRGSRIGASAFPNDGGSLMDRLGIDKPDELLTLEGMEERYIRHVMEATESVEEAAEVLGVAPSTLWRRRRKYGI